MANLNGFNAATVEPSQDFEPIPAGKYLAMITESEMKPTKSGGGQYLQLTFQMLDGPYKGRYVWARLNCPTIRSGRVAPSSARWAATSPSHSSRN